MWRYGDDRRESDFSGDNAIGSENCVGWSREADIDERKGWLRDF
jgi:hypothetical protein